MKIKYILIPGKKFSLEELQKDLDNYNTDETKRRKDKINVIKRNWFFKSAFDKINPLIKVDQLDMMADVPELNMFSLKKIDNEKIEIIMDFNQEKIDMLNKVYSLIGQKEGKRLKRQTREALKYYGKIESEVEMI